MKDIAEIEYFIIKYIEKFSLNYTVGLGSNYPQKIWFIPNNFAPDYQIADEELKDLDVKTNIRLNNLSKFITSELLK